MPAMNTVEDADGEEQRTAQSRKFGNGVEDFHHGKKCEVWNAKREIRNRDNV